jgi:hypothetical protein
MFWTIWKWPKCFSRLWHFRFLQLKTCTRCAPSLKTSMTKNMYDSCFQKKLNTYKKHQGQLHCAIKDMRSATQFQKLISATQKALSRNKTRRNCNIQEFILYLSNYGHWQTEVLEENWILDHDLTTPSKPVQKNMAILDRCCENCRLGKFWTSCKISVQHLNLKD